MKVVLRIRSDVREFPGGDYVHLQKTRRTLEELGMECQVLPGLEPLPAKVDAVHLFNLTRIHETALQFAEAKRRGLPVILTPIWHSMREMKRFYARRYRLPVFPIWPYMALKELHYARRSRLRPYWPATLRYRHLQRQVAGGAEMVIVSSRAELEIMQEELQVQPRAAVTVPPPFDAEPAAAPSTPSALARRDFICAGRIEPRKNQLAVVRAFKSLGRGEDRLLFYGAAGAAHSAYYRAVAEEFVPGWIEHRGHVTPEELGKVYAGARAGVQASHFETCGFSTMEALAQGAHAVVSESPYTREFYGDRVSWCDPFSEPSIARALGRTLTQPFADNRDLLQAYSWSEALRGTREAYRSVIL